MSERKKISEALLEYQSSSNGKMAIHIEDIREFLIEELKSTRDHTKLCRGFEALTGRIIVNRLEDDECMKVVQ